MTQVLIDRATLEKVLNLAFNLGQTYWQQAVSDYVSQQNKSDGTRKKFNQLITDTCAAHAKVKLAEDVERYRWLRDYLISPSTHFDDLIVSADKAETLDGVIDAARAKGAK